MAQILGTKKQMFPANYREKRSLLQSRAKAQTQADTLT
jgi:predicted unusual protein kinase regulating ubiquinone biosynthesis (AarF/ABC1/UbiB family)